MNNFIFICEEDFKDIIKEAVILAILYSNNNNNNDDRKDDNNNDVHESKEN